MGTADSHFTAWSIDPYQRKNGRLIFYRQDAEATLKEVIFEEAYCVTYEEYMVADNLVQVIGISPRKLTVNGVTHNNQWEQ